LASQEIPQLSWNLSVHYKWQHIPLNFLKFLSSKSSTSKAEIKIFIVLYHLDLIPHLQGEALQYLGSQCSHLGFKMGGIGVAYLSCVINV
jgi:hypothetical protein